VQDLHWVNDIAYVDAEHHQHTVAVIRCLETKPAAKTERKTTRFKWITNFDVQSTNVLELANHGGRLRWKIENEGFNVQKNGGYALEHIFTHNPVAAKVFYLLLQLAHTLAQLIEHSNLLCQAIPHRCGLGQKPGLAALGSLAQCPPQCPAHPTLVGHARPDPLPATLAPGPRCSGASPPTTESYPRLGLLSSLLLRLGHSPLSCLRPPLSRLCP
jgi:hypothetical protein